MLVAMINIHAPEAESIHDLTQSVIIVVELDGSHNVEDDLGVLSMIDVSGNIAIWAWHNTNPMYKV